MTLLEHLKGFVTPAEVQEFAAACDTSPAHLWQVARGYRRAGEYLCINIDRESGGKVRCEDLRPDVDWAYLRGTSVQEGKAA